MEQEDENISLLLNMGFPDVRAIKRALRMANGDLNEAVLYLTEQPLTSYNTVDDLRAVDMADASGSAPPSYEECVGESGGGLEFPATHLYELEGRVFVDSWSIPYKRHESLGKCLHAAATLAAEGLCEVDESCQRFMERCLPECFRKLLSSGAVRRWSPEVQEGVFTMLDLLTALVLARLKHPPIPENLLKNTYALALDSKCEWNQKNKHRSPEYNAEVIYASCSSQFEPYGWLVDLINTFCNRGGLDLIADHFKEKVPAGKEGLPVLDAGQMDALLYPLGICGSFLVAEKVRPILQPVLQVALDYVASIHDNDLKSQRIGCCYELLESVRLLCVQVWPSQVERTRELRMDMIIRMLKTPHFSARMNALKELGRLVEERTEGQRGGSSQEADIVQEWIMSSNILALALEGNLDQVQYTDRMKELVEFLGPKLEEEQLTRMWRLAEKASPHVVDNVHRIMAAAASRFNPHQFAHLLSLISKSWECGNARLREKLLSFIGQIGQDSRLGRTAEKMLDLLWDLARVPALPPHLVHHALAQHLNILNEAATREELRKRYIVRCVEDIKRSPAVYLPLKQLHGLAKAVTKGSSAYFKADKATLSDLNRTHDLVKLVTTSLARCHALATQVHSCPPSPATLIDGKYTHDDYLRAHLDFLQFLLKEGDMFLAWARCKDLWETLVANPNASHHDNKTCFRWFSSCISDLEGNTQRDLFCEKLLRLEPVTLTPEALECFTQFFHAVNLNDRKLHRQGGNIVVEKVDPLGLDFLWRIVLECSDETLAEEAMKSVLAMTFHALNPRLRKEPASIHGRFIQDCYRKLEKSLVGVDKTALSSVLTAATTTLTAPSVSAAPAPNPSRGACLQHIRRVLVLAERYVWSIEELHDAVRVLLPHAASFTGIPTALRVTCEGAAKNVFVLQCHSNETLLSVRSKIATAVGCPVEHVQLVLPESANSSVSSNSTQLDNRLLHQLQLSTSEERSKDGEGDGAADEAEDQKYLAAKITSGGAAHLKEVNNWDELPGLGSYCDVASGPSPSSCSSSEATGAVSSSGGAGMSEGRQQYKLEQEKQLPGVVMAAGRDVFNLLYHLAQLDDTRVTEAVRRLLYLIPSNPSVADKFDSICTSSASKDPHGRMSTSPSKRGGLAAAAAGASSSAGGASGSASEQAQTQGRQVLKSLLDLSSPGMTPFRLLYNLEVLSGKLVPVGVEGQMVGGFCESFLRCGGLGLITALLQRDAFPVDLHYQIRQNIYLIALQLLKFVMMGGSGTGGVSSRPQDPPLGLQSQASQPPGQIKLTPPKRSTLDASVQSVHSTILSAIQASLAPPLVNRAMQLLSENEWSELVSSLMVLAWAAAAGKLFLVSSTLSKDTNTELPTSEGGKSSSRQSSTGSVQSLTGEVEGLQCGLCVQQAMIPAIDALVAQQSLQLMVACIRMRPNLIERWYAMGGVREFLVEVLVGCSSRAVREQACQQFTALTTLSTPAPTHPSTFLTQVLLKAPLPLWVSSSSTRGATQRLLQQCEQYFSLRCKLLTGLSAGEQETLGVNAAQMLEDEVCWLSNFTSTREAARERPESGIAALRQADNILLAGHLRLITALLSCWGVDAAECGQAIITQLLHEYLFPASKLVLESAPNQEYYSASRNYSAKCTGRASRLAAYELLVQLATHSLRNLQHIASALITLHHRVDPHAARDFEHSPAVDGRGSSGYVGLKNGGATCYMNSVLQQLFLVPGIREDILAVSANDPDEESLFYQLQTVFGHLLESQLQYYVPDKFWKCFRMDGQPVNVREQQDAFEFYTRLTEQIDDCLKRQKLEDVFARRFQGVYSVQRICQDCPHRYEREEPFLALNLTVTKCNDLQDSLDQFVKGEMLEGDNAYFCERCSQKRSALVRTCIKNLPPVLVIQLKRFGYDWEASRALKFDDYFKFPWVVDMGAYTAEGIAEREASGSSMGERSTSSSGSSVGNERASVSPSGDSSCSSPERLREDDHMMGTSSSSPLASSSPPTTSSFRGPKAALLATPPKLHTKLRRSSSAPYQLVGVIVHSGQANAGHYYAYIKDRRGDELTNPNKDKWFKFNDTSVDPVVMTDALLEQECFGGAYTAKVSYDASNPLPEDRLRYWNAYMLLYDCVEEPGQAPRTPKTPRTSARTFRASTSCTPRKSSSLGGSRPARNSLCQLNELLQHGERFGMFRQDMPPAILNTITHDNLTFLKNRDVYSPDYFGFVNQLCSANLENIKQEQYEERCTESLALGLNFLLNTFLRTKSREESEVVEWGDLLHRLLRASAKASAWARVFLAGEGSIHVQPLLLECPNKMVRTHFSLLLQRVLQSELAHTGSVASNEALIRVILALLPSHVPAALKTSQQYFLLLQHYCSQGESQCRQVLAAEGLEVLVQFLLGPKELDKRRWTSVQAQDFAPLHSAIATLIDSTRPYQETRVEDDGSERMIPDCVRSLLYGKDQARWLCEVVLAYREVTGPLPQLTELLMKVAKGNRAFTTALITAIMNQYASSPSNMLKDLTQLLLDILNLRDELQEFRTRIIVDGMEGTKGGEAAETCGGGSTPAFSGLLDLIRLNKDTDGRRAYQCIKLVVSMALRSPIARDFLTSTQSRWQWSVAWLRGSMDNHQGGGDAASSSLSNEDSNTKNFQRTTSAQFTLEEATALLNDFDPTEMEVDGDELADIKENTAEHDIGSSHDLEDIDP
ncbi:ubiquitin carboxyl-terminal hydrolase 24-like isoform X2 [Oratosquilla oratoria]|uniref:ubiquitin carboxyl-terminal hydrolase 24-like isoform X2 n=1 Tax=Oratosquilla oratoria TaxID=337810 RepID=UPI003F76BA53